MLISPTSRGRSIDQILNTLGEDASLLESGLTALEQDFQLLGPVVVDILAVDKNGTPTALLAGESEEALLARAFQLRRGWTSVIHLLRRVFDRSGIRVDHGLRVILLSPRFSDGFRESIAALPEIPGSGTLEVFEFQFASFEGRRIPVFIDPCSETGASSEIGPSESGYSKSELRQSPAPNTSRLPVEREDSEPAPQLRAPSNGVDKNRSIDREASISPSNPTPREPHKPSEKAPQKIEREAESVNTLLPPLAGAALYPGPPAAEIAYGHGNPERKAREVARGLFDEARRKILRIDSGILEDADGDSVVFTVGGQRLARIERRSDGLVGMLGDESSETVVADHQMLNSFLNSSFRFYFRLCTPVSEDSE